MLKLQLTLSVYSAEKKSIIKHNQTCEEGLTSEPHVGIRAMLALFFCQGCQIVAHHFIIL
jgi:hypothetical protein